MNEICFIPSVPKSKKDEEKIKIKMEVTVMSKADEMLKKLGYEKIEESKRYLRYSTDKRYGEHIDFELKLKQVRCTRVTCQGNTHFRYFSMQELQAINKKCQELGWIE